MRLERHRQEIEIGSVAQQVLMDANILRHRAVGADPHLTGRFSNVAFQRVVKLHRADFQRFVAEELIFGLRRQQVRQLTRDVGFGRQTIRRRGDRHQFLMLIAGLRGLERGGHIKNRFPVLNGRDPTGAEAVAIAQHFDVINNRFLAVARAQEIAVE